MPLTADSPEILWAAEALTRDEMVILPTETVYGLGANALSDEAVGKIFRAKGRPTENPLICHVYEGSQARDLAREWPEEVQVLADAFWPGALTVVLRKRDYVPDSTTGGLGTVAVREPSHPVFREVLRRFNGPVAAPSANRFMGVSPTRVEDLDMEIVSQCAIVLDGGPCKIGIESTVVDLSSERPTILRLGGVSREAIEKVLNTPLLAGGEIRKSPGMYRRHYSPRTPVVIEKHIGDKPGLVFDREPNPNQLVMPASATGYASELYRSLHQLDHMALKEFFIEAPPEGPEWAAIWDRLLRASGGFRHGLLSTNED